MDATKAIITALYSRMLNDTALVDLMRGTRPHWEGPYTRVPEDPPWPFITHRLSTIEGADNATRPANYTIEVWDWGEDMTRIWAVRARLMAILDLARITIPGQGVLRLWFSSETTLPNADRNELNTTLAFTVRYARAGEVRAITEGTT